MKTVVGLANAWLNWELEVTLQLAKLWTKAGPVFPALYKDVWRGAKLYCRKAPATINGHLDATTDINQLESWWAEDPDYLVGLALGTEIVVLDIDVDLETGEDGFDRLRTLKLPIPDTYWQETPSGGRHYFYRGVPGLSLGPWNNYLQEFQGDKSGVDRKTGSSYVIAYSEAVPDVSALATVPEWLTRQNATTSLYEYSGTLGDWLESLEPGVPDQFVTAAILSFPDSEFDHQVMIRQQMRLVRLGAEKHPGVLEALDLLRTLWTFGKYNTEEYRLEWIRALEGAVRKYGGESKKEMENATK